MKIAGVSLWIWAMGIAVLITGSWAIATRPHKEAIPSRQTIDLPRPVLARSNVEKPQQPRPVDVELARLRLEGLKQEAERRQIEAAARAKGLVPRQRIVRDKEAETMSHAELSAEIERLENSGYR